MNTKRKIKIRYAIAEIVSGHLIICETALYNEGEIDQYIRKKIEESPDKTFTYLPYYKLFFGETAF